MGSLFYINVPVREYEFELRKREHQIGELQDKDKLGSYPGNAYRRSIGSIQGVQAITTAAGVWKDSDIAQSVYTQQPMVVLQTSSENLDENTSSSPSVVDVYAGVAEGSKKVNILLSHDTIEIVDSSDFHNLSSDTNVTKKIQDEEMENVQNKINMTFLEKHLEHCLQKFVIYDATWGASIDGNFAQVSFTVNAGRSEEIINYMITLGIGIKYQSTLSVCAAIVYYNEKQEEKKQQQKLVESGSAESSTEKTTFGAKFIASIKSRLTVAQVIQSVQSNATMTFDFIVLIIVAGIIAGLGLLENSSVNLVASMLISPLMGPIMAGCFGAVIRDWKLVKTGVISELVGLGICLLVGFFFGICVAWHPFDGPWAKVNIWPTDEMVARSKLRGMVVGVFIAIPSGAGVALSILGGNAGSLVGVAISASLLPPAVNAGLFWGMAAVISIEEQIHQRSVLKGCNEIIGPNVTSITQFYTRSHTPVYCENVLVEYGMMGICSFGLTMLNIILILLTGAIVLKIKEVAPHTTRKTMNRFWKEDLKAMRDYNKEHGGFNQQALFNEISNAQNSKQLKMKLANDHTYNQVTRRNVFGNGVDILENANDADISNSRDVEDGTNDATQQQLHEPSMHPRHQTVASGGILGSIWSGMFGGGHKSLESELVSEGGTPGTNSPHMIASKTKAIKHAAGGF